MEEYLQTYLDRDTDLSYLDSYNFTDEDLEMMRDNDYEEGVT